MGLPSIEEYKAKKDRVKSLSSKAMEARGVISARKSELDSILKKYNVSSVDELKSLYNEKLEHGEKVLKAVDDYITDTSSKLELLEKKIASTGEVVL